MFHPNSDVRDTDRTQIFEEAGARQPEIQAQLGAFRQAAMADGWVSDPMTKRFATVTLRKTGFIMRIETRTRFMHGAVLAKGGSIQIWGPDGISVPVPKRYNFAEIERAIMTCGLCREEVTNIQRLGAMRSCTKCILGVQPPVQDARLVGPSKEGAQ